jgi:hypothetical protein
VRVYRSDPEGVTLQIRHEREYMSAWLSFADALAVADAICEAARKSGTENVTADVSDGTSARLINARFGPLLRTLKSDIWRGPRSVTSGCEQPQQTAPIFDHSITRSAAASSIFGITMPRAFAVLRLITSSNFVGVCTGRSAGFAPRRMRLTYFAARLNRSEVFTP